jgi:hypothetical protein
VTQPRRRQSPKPAPALRRRRGETDYRPLDRDASIGQYQIDGYAFLYVRNGNNATYGKLPDDGKRLYVELLRGGINRAAQIAIVRERFDRKGSETRKFAQRFLETLAGIDTLTAWLPAGDDASLIAADMARVFDAKPPETSVVPSVMSIIDHIRSIRAWHTRLGQSFALAPPLPSNVDLLSQHFVRAVADFHEHYTDRKPPASRTSVFANLLAAAWEDLKFPMLLGKDGRSKESPELAVFFGYKAERAFQPHLKTKKPFQLR